MANGVVDLLEVVNVAHHQTQRGAHRLRLGDSLGEIGTEAAAVGDLGERVTQAYGLRLGKGRVQLLNLELGGLEPALEIGNLIVPRRSRASAGADRLAPG